MEQPRKAGAPAWMVSFGDMMTLILTFFILLVALSKEQQGGLVAAGVGSFVLHLRSFGMPGILSGAERESILAEVRQRFDLPPEPDPERRADPLDASSLELIRAEVATALAPHHELGQPAVAVFEPGSARLGDPARRFLDLLAPALRPGPGSVLLIEGHAPNRPNAEGTGRWLAYERARAVARHLVEEHGFPPARVEVRAWLAEVETSGIATRSVDARLVSPGRPADRGER